MKNDRAVIFPGRYGENKGIFGAEMRKSIYSITQTVLCESGFRNDFLKVVI